MKHTHNSPLIHLESQPNFPAVDLTDANAELLPLLFEDQAGIEAQATFLQTHQHGLYLMAHRALIACDYPAKEGLEEYKAFTRGFSTFDAISMAVRPTENYDTSLASLKALWSLMMPGEFTDIELSKGFRQWPEERPKTHELVIKIGEQKNETMNQLRARTIGAYVAFDLQRPLFDAV